MLSRDELAYANRQQLLAHIDALEAFRARVLAVARPLRAAQVSLDEVATAGRYDYRYIVAYELRETCCCDVCAMAMALAEEAGDG